ncbi:MAG: hypothetical protein AAFZ38_02185 [Myxococcota bacterium]
MTTTREQEPSATDPADPSRVVEASAGSQKVSSSAIRLELSETGIVWDDDDDSAQISVRALDTTTGAPVELAAGDIIWYTTQPHNVSLGTSSDEGDSISLLRVASGPVSTLLFAAPSETAPFLADAVFAAIESAPDGDDVCEAETCNESTRPREASCDTFPEPLQSEFAEIEYDGRGLNGLLPFPLPVPGIGPVTGVVYRTKRFYFPVGSEHRAVSRTGKTMCFKLDGQYHCHVSGTTTGFTADWPNNFENSANSAVGNCVVTDDSQFVFAYYGDAVRRDHTVKFNISGHSQGASDIAASGSMLHLGPGDQVVLLQPAASNLGNQCGLNEAQCGGAKVTAALTLKDIVSVGAEPTNTCINMPVMDDIRNPEEPNGCRNPNRKPPGPPSPPSCDESIHSAPYARHLFHLEANVPAGSTCNPAFDASIISNPDSPSSAFGTWELPPMAQGSTEFDLCYCGIISGYREECPGETPEECREPTDPAPASNTGAPEPPADRAPPPNSPRPSRPSFGPTNAVGHPYNCRTSADGTNWWNQANECFEACPAGAISNSTAFGGSGATACICDIENGFVYDPENPNTCTCAEGRGFDGTVSDGRCDCISLAAFDEATNSCQCTNHQRVMQELDGEMTCACDASRGFEHAKNRCPSCSGNQCLCSVHDGYYAPSPGGVAQRMDDVTSCVTCPGRCTESNCGTDYLWWAKAGTCHDGGDDPNDEGSSWEFEGSACEAAYQSPASTEDCPIRGSSFPFNSPTDTLRTPCGCPGTY